MQFEQLLNLVGDQPLFETGLLLSGEVDPNDVRRQLSRWVSAGRLKQLRRGLYIIILMPPYQKNVPHPFLVANSLMPGSYVSAQSALAYYGLIPEYVARTWSVTNSRPAQWEG
jgi:predicted transcriptional regulator of viral defense system